jgi:cobalt-zinc-cadmium efflux system membrane fusion protein
MNKITILLLLTTTLLGISVPAQASEQHNQSAASGRAAAEHKDEHDHEKLTTTISAQMAEKVGIKTALAGPQSLQQTVTAYGRLVASPENTSSVRARFPGIIQSVHVSTGDQVSKGDLLAVVESNESLKRYDLRAPINGIVLQRYISAGELAQQQALFSLANFDTLWAELRVFPATDQATAKSSKVYIDTGKQVLATTVSHLLPADEGAPYLIARAKINDAENTLLPGLMVEGRIVTNEFDSSLAVANTALQFMEDEKGVFIKHADNYIFHPLKTGRTDNRFTEVISGIEPGAEYVIENSYLIKADIEKSAAEHEH